MKVKAVIFDMDGLLLDSERPFRDAWLAAIRKRGYEMDEVAYLEVIGRRDADVRDYFLGYFGKDFPFEVMLREIAGTVNALVEIEGYRAKEGAAALASFLRERNIPLMVATSTEQKEARRRLEKAGLLSYFSTITSGDEVKHGKPAPDIFLLAATRLGLPPADCLVLEDSIFGAMAARAAGMPVIVVPDLKPPTDKVRGFAMGVFPSLTRAHPAVEKWIGAN
jgi:HAD superfamily hydrolase (TIGR01549 family)